jgi:hypothetical protein
MELSLSKLTVTQIKESIGQLGFKPPSGLKKAELQRYYQGALKMKQEGIPATNPKKTSHINYTPVYPDQSLDLMNHLQTYGWAVANIPDYNSAAIRQELLEWIHRHSPNFDSEKFSTWTRQNIPYNVHGIFKQWVGHLEPIWKTRGYF